MVTGRGRPKCDIGRTQHGARLSACSVDVATIRGQYRIMRSANLVALALASLFAAGPVLAADDLCKQVNAFERKPPDKLPDGSLQRRWMDFSWAAPEEPATLQDVQIGATLKCHGSDDVARALCRFTLKNSPHENSTSLPLSILRCHTLAPDRPMFPKRWVEEVSWDVPSGLVGRLQVDQLARHGVEPSMRLTVMPFPESPQARKPAPFFKSLSDKLDLWDGGDE